MPIVSFNSEPEALRDGDLFIVGAGAVGIAMAVSLARKGQAVTLVEAGPRLPRADYANANDGPTTGRPFRGLREGRMKAYGGTTRLWGGQLVPFDRGDLESEDEAGQRLWPISYEEFLPWIDAAYGLLGIDQKARAFETLWRRATGRDMVLGHGLTTLMNIWLPQPDFTILFASELEKNPLITIVTDAEVQRLRFGPDGAVEALDVGPADGQSRQVRPERVVIANGTFEIARQLLRAQALEPNCPFRDNQNVGRWYIDHLHGIAGEIDVADQKKFSDLFDHIFHEKRKYNVKIRELERAKGAANIVVSVNPKLTVRGLLSDASQLFRRVVGGNLSFFAALKESAAMAKIMMPLAWRYLVTHRATMLVGQGVQFGLEIEQLPHKESYLYLDPASPAEIAKIGVHWHLDGHEFEAVRTITSALSAAFRENGLGTVKLDDAILAGDPAFLDKLRNSGHYMGGARMALNSDSGVVDRNCRVFGTNNLYVAGAAVFPTGSFANSTLSAIALGLRLADHLTDSPRI